jgi:hypothetical protein
MQIRTLPKGVFLKPLLRALILEGMALSWAVLLFLKYPPPWIGIAVGIIASGAFNFYFMKLLMQRDCPECQHRMSRKSGRHPFHCEPCKIAWKMPDPFSRS